MSSTKKDRKIRSISGKDFQSSSGGGDGFQGNFASAVAAALRREYGGTHAAIKTVAALTGANERAVKNWFDAKNGPSGGLLISLCRYSDEVLEAFLLMSDRGQLVTAKKLVDARKKLREILSMLNELMGGEPG